MKSFFILVLIVGLGAALFFTRPTSDDFKQYAKDHPEIVRGKTAIDDSIADRITHQFKTFSSLGSITLDPVQDFINSCTFENKFYMWTNVSQNGQLIYTGVVGHWFKRTPASPATPTHASP